MHKLNDMDFPMVVKKVHDHLIGLPTINMVLRVLKL